MKLLFSIILLVGISPRLIRAQESPPPFPWRFEKVAALDTQNPEASVVEYGGALVDGRGVVSYIDRQSNRIRFRGIYRFDSNGEWIGFISRRGEGPGEFISAKLLATSHGGELLAFGQSTGRRIARFTKEGDFISSFPSPFRQIDGGAYIRPDNYLLSSPSLSDPRHPGGDWTQTISVIDSEGTILWSIVFERVNHTILIQVENRPGQFHFYPNPAANICKWTVDGEGSIWIIPPENDRLQKYSPEGGISTEVGIDLNPPEYSARDWNELVSVMTAYRRNPDYPGTLVATDLIVDVLKGLRREISPIQRFWWIDSHGFLVDRLPFDIESTGWQEKPGRYLALFPDGTSSEEIEGPGGLVAVSYGYALSFHTDEDELPILTLYRLVPNQGIR